jgi:putative transposase
MNNGNSLPSAARQHGMEIRLSEYRRSNHTELGCEYHIIFIPTYRKKAPYGKLRSRLGAASKQLAHQKESEIEKGHLQPDHVRMLISVPPNYAVAQAVGFLEGKSAIYTARNFGEVRHEFVGKHFWDRGYFASMVGRDEDTIRRYIQR